MTSPYPTRTDRPRLRLAPRPANGSVGLLPPPALGERCHRGLARRLELRCAAAPEWQYLASLRSGLWDLLANDYAATYLHASFVAAISARRWSVDWRRDRERALWGGCHNRLESIGLDH